jgi:hypothetical protein
MHDSGPIYLVLSTLFTLFNNSIQGFAPFTLVITLSRLLAREGEE